MGQFDGLLELDLSASNPTHSVTDLGSGNPLPSPKFFDFASLTNIPFVETNIEGSLVIVSNVFLQQPEIAGFIGGASINMTNVNGKLLNLFVNANASDVIAEPVPIFASSAVGIFDQFTTSVPATNSYELDLLQYANLESGTPPIPQLSIKQVGTNVIVTWNDIFFSLQTNLDLTGPFVDAPGAKSPFTNAMDVPAKFYRLKQ
jgi:hypothetical protein